MNKELSNVAAIALVVTAVVVAIVIGVVLVFVNNLPMGDYPIIAKFAWAFVLFWAILFGAFFVFVVIRGAILRVLWKNFAYSKVIGRAMEKEGRKVDRAISKFVANLENEPHLRKVTLYEFQTHTYAPNVNPKTWHVLGDKQSVDRFLSPPLVSRFDWTPDVEWKAAGGQAVYVGTWSKRDVRRFRRMLRERGAELEISYEKPADLGTKTARRWRESNVCK